MVIKANFRLTCLHFWALLLGIGFASNLWADDASAPSPTPAPVQDSLKAQKAREFLRRGNQYEERGFADKAKEFWKIALDLDPHLQEARERLQGKSGSATEAVPGETPVSKEASGIQRRRFQEFLATAQSAYEGNNYGEAQKYVELAAQMAPVDPQVKTLRSKILLEDFKDDPDRPYNKLVKSDFLEAVEYYHHKHYAQALEKLEQAQNIDPDQLQVRDFTAQVQLENSDVLNAKEVQRAQKEWKEDNGDMALEILNNVLKKSPQFQPALDLKKQISSVTEKEKFDQVAPLLSKARRTEGADQFLEARKYYQEVLKNDPQNEEARKGLERVMGLIDPLLKKLKELESAIDANQKEKAQAALEEIEQLAPKHPKLASWRKKIAALGKSNETSEDSQAKADEAYNLGVESYRKDNWVEAKRFWVQAVELNPQHLQAKRSLDRLLEDHPDLK
jgi:tetratricopeptide (TPR) repeat protein